MYVPAPIPKNELDRLRSLLEYQILDTDQERSFDEIAKLAATICGTPMAMISLVDQDRQWFKSHHGTNMTQTERDIAVCPHVVYNQDLLIVPDLKQDPRFSENPLVTGPSSLRFYAGAPLTTAGQHTLGALCVVDTQPRELLPNQIEALQILARQVMDLLELHKSKNKISNLFNELQKHTKQIAEHQAMLVHSAKMASLGEMAAGIAHEINNPLSIIVGKLNAATVEISQSHQMNPKALELIRSAEGTAFRISKIISGLNSFARSADREVIEVHDLDKLLNEVYHLTQQRFRDNNIHFQLPPPTHLQIKCRSVEISQVLINLLNNAFDAVQKLSKPWVKILVDSEADFIRIRVVDSGAGIPPENHLRIMEPFFTTKEVGRGTGLGLSISRGLMAANHGQIYLDANATNTTFVLMIPNATATFGEKHMRSVA